MDDTDEDMQPERTEQESKPLLDNITKASLLVHILGASCIFLQVFSYTMSVVSTQVAGLDIDIFQYNTIRYILQGIIAFCVAWHCKNSIKIHRDDLSYFVTVAVLDMTASVCIYATATFLPVGTLDAFFNAVLAIIATCYDVIKRHISYLGVITYFVLGLGILLLTQPWNNQMKGILIHMTPCDYLGENHSITGLLYNGDNISNITIPSITEPIDVADTDSSPRYYSLLGYTLLTIAALEYSGHARLSRSLLEKYHVTTVIFWIALIDGILSFTVSVIWQSLRQESILMVPAGQYCVLFMCLYIIFSGISNFCAYYVLHYCQVFVYTVFLVCSSLLLYIIQRTALKHFYPGNANLVEILGVGLILFGIAGLPLLGKLVKSRRSESEFDNEH